MYIYIYIYIYDIGWMWIPALCQVHTNTTQVATTLQGGEPLPLSSRYQMPATST